MKNYKYRMVLVCASFIVAQMASAAEQQLRSDEQSFPDAGFTTPDGLIGHPYKETGTLNAEAKDPESVRFNTLGNWAGNVASDTTHTIMSAGGYFMMPTAVTCNSTHDLFAPWVGLNGYPPGNSTVQQAGVAISCATGSPVLQAWWEMAPANPVYISTSLYPVLLGDVIQVGVTNRSGSYTIQIFDFGPNDLSLKWSFSTVQNGPTTATSGEAIVESPPTSYPRFGTVPFGPLGGDSTPGARHSLFGVGTDLPAVTTLNAGFGSTIEVSSSGISQGGFNSPNFVTTYVHQ
jgi:hypothetical protein